MVITKAISQRVLVGASVISLLLIAGSIYLHLQQEPHLGRMNSSAKRVKSHVSEEGFADEHNNTHISLNDTQANLNTTKGLPYNKDNTNNNNHNLLVDDYLNDDDAYKMNSNEKFHKAAKAIRHKSSTSKYVLDNDDDGTDLDVEYVDPISRDNGDSAVDELKNATEEQYCFHCLCMTVNECKPFKCAHIDPCGIYGISKYYWLDGNSPRTIKHNNNDYGEVDEQYIEYLQCVNDQNCAEETVRNYIKRYQRDCNNDGVIDCQDHIALHLLGPSGCKTKGLTPLRKLRMMTCLKH